MPENKFTEDDKDKFIKFLNFIGNKAEFNNMNTEEIINYFNLLSYMQKVMLPKIDANILEIIKVSESKEETDNKEE